MLFIKPGASVRGVQPEIVLGIMVVVTVYADHNLDLTITEGTGSTHQSGSLHYVGLAADLRSSNVPAALKDQIIKDVKAALDVEYDFIVEGDHFHIEYQPKLPAHG